MKKDIFVECSCGCSIITIAESDVFGDGQNTIFISHYGNSFGDKQTGLWDIIKRRFKLVWCGLTGKEYFLWEIVLDKESQVKDFKDAVAALDETKAGKDW
jgi:hypothetical protein